MAAGRSKGVSRRKFLAGSAGVAVSGSALSRSASAQTSAPAAGERPAIIDFHNHFVDPAIPLARRPNMPPGQRAYWEAVDRNLTDPDALLSSIESAGLAARVVSTPPAMVTNQGAELPLATIRQINDGLAELAGKHRGRIHALATIDAFSGEAGAREVTRAVRELGLPGIFIESASGNMLPDAPQARPAFAAAAALGVPVFIHPVNDPALHPRLVRYGRLGQQLSRGAINAAALVALLEGGVFDELPNLRVVVTTLAIGGLMIAGGFGAGARLRSDTPAMTRRHIYVDTMGLHPVLMRSVVDLMGADHVLVGTDWPIFVEEDVPSRLQAAFAHCGLGASDQHAIARGNAMQLLRIA